MSAVERDEPRISLNQLTEYLVTNSARRKRIIEQQKRPSDFQVIYYQDAQNAIQAFIAGAMVDEEVLVDAMESILARQPANDYDEVRIASNAEAIESFLDIYELVDLQSLTPSVAPDSQPKLRIAGIDLSVRPEIIVRGDVPRHGRVVGGVKLYFSKREKARLDDDSGKYPSSLLYEHLCEIEPDCKVLHSACIVIDVFGRTIFMAPRSRKRVLADVAVACEEIAIWWEHI